MILPNKQKHTFLYMSVQTRWLMNASFCEFQLRTTMLPHTEI